MVRPIVQGSPTPSALSVAPAAPMSAAPALSQKLTRWLASNMVHTIGQIPSGDPVARFAAALERWSTVGEQQAFWQLRAPDVGLQVWTGEQMREFIKAAHSPRYVIREAVMAVHPVNKEQRRTWTFIDSDLSNPEGVSPLVGRVFSACSRGGIAPHTLVVMAPATLPSHGSYVPLKDVNAHLERLLQAMAWGLVPPKQLELHLAFGLDVPEQELLPLMLAVSPEGLPSRLAWHSAQVSDTLLAGLQRVTGTGSAWSTYGERLRALIAQGATIYQEQSSLPERSRYRCLLSLLSPEIVTVGVRALMADEPQALLDGSFDLPETGFNGHKTMVLRMQPRAPKPAAGLSGFRWAT